MAVCFSFHWADSLSCHLIHCTNTLSTPKAFMFRLGATEACLSGLPVPKLLERGTVWGERELNRMTGRKMLLYQFSDILPLTSFIKMLNYHIYLPWYLHGTWYCVQYIRKLLQYACFTDFSLCVLKEIWCFFPRW